MLRFLLKRILYVIPVAFGVSVICFLLVHLAPGDPLVSILPPDASAQLQAEMRTIYGFDRPLPVQFGLWLSRALQGDLGTSIATGRSVIEEVSRAVGNTVMLAMLAAMIGFVFGLLFGFLAGAARLAACSRRGAGRLGLGLGAFPAHDPAGGYDVGHPHGTRHSHGSRAGG
jgi:peptide/nickel transport system permease protein